MAVNTRRGPGRTVVAGVCTARIRLLLDLRQIDPDVGHCLEALRRFLAEAPQDRPLEIVRQRRNERARESRLTLHHGRQRLGRCLASEGALARGHLVQQCAEAEDVRARVHWSARCLFRRHVRECAHALPGFGQVLDHMCGGGRVRRLVFLVEQLGQPEVEHLDTAIRAHDNVRGLQIPMDDAAGMCGRQGVGDGDGNPQRLAESQPGTGNERVETLAADVFHDQEVDAIGRFDFVHRYDVRVAQSGCSARFA